MGGASTPSSPVEVVERLEFAQAADLSADGGAVAWVKSAIDGDAERFELHVVDLKCGTDLVVPGGRDPVWAPEGRRLTFNAVQARDDPQLCILEATTGVVRELRSLPRPPSSQVSWSPDGRWLAVAVAPTKQDRSVPYRITRVVGWRDGAGLVDDAAADIWVYDLDTDEAHPLTEDDWINGSPIWIDGGREIAYIASCPPEAWDDHCVIRAVDTSGTIRDLLVSDDVTAISAVKDQNGLLVFTAGGSFRDEEGDLRVLAADGVWESRSQGLGIDVMGTLIGDLPIPYADGAARILLRDGWALVPVHTQDRLSIHQIALEAELFEECLITSDGCVYPLAIANGVLLYAEGDVLHPPDLWVCNLLSRKTQRISDTAAHNLGEIAPVKVERFWVHNDSEPDVQAKLLLPANASGPLPTVVIIHGGPYAAFGECFIIDAQLLCEAGFAVLMANPRGSRGYGPEFGGAIEANWGGPDFRDVMRTIDHAVAQGWSDPDRLGVTGLSYGGYLTAWIVANSSRFKAAVVENGVTNLVSMYGTSDVGLSYLPQALARTPDEDPDTYRRCSPITTAHTAVTPTLLIVGSEDHRCPPEQALQLYSVLRRAGCQAELLILPGASHGGSIDGPVIVRRAQNAGLLEWMERHV